MTATQAQANSAGAGVSFGLTRQIYGDNDCRAEPVRGRLPGWHVRALRRFAAAEWSRPPCGKFFLQNCAVQIVHAVAERDLRERQSQADPVSGQMVDVVEVNAADREIAKLLKRRGAFYVGEDPWVVTVRKQREQTR